jgi:hypothetical protein
MKSNESAVEYFLQDFLDLLIERAKQAKWSRNAAKARCDTTQGSFEAGLAQAYYEVLSSLIHEAETFGLSKERIPGLSFDPDKELLS